MSQPHQPEPDLTLLDRLQEKMEERLARKVPVKGRFCGYCYARLRDERRCPFCGRDIAAVGTVDEIPQPVLRAYRAKGRIEAAWVYSLGFVGLLLASILFMLLVLWGPAVLGHPAIAFAVLIGGGYVLARAFGEIVGGHFGVARGRKKRNELWLAFLWARDRGAQGNPGPGDS